MPAALMGLHPCPVALASRRLTIEDNSILLARLSRAASGSRPSSWNTSPSQRRQSEGRLVARVSSRPLVFSLAIPNSKLADLPLQSVINPQGLILPEVDPAAQAFVFCIFDEKQKLQYVGFSKDLRNSLRTVFSRRPEKTHYYKFVSLPSLDQSNMAEIRDAWFQETGGAPPGNKLALERTQWQQPVDAGAISQRGKQGAAEEKCRQLLQAIKERGSREAWDPNPALLQDGLVDFLPVRAQTSEEVEAGKQAAAAAAKRMRTGVAIVDGHPKNFQINYKRKTPTNGGCMMDLTVLFDDKETSHRVIVGKQYYEPYGLAPEATIEAAFAFIFSHKLVRQTDGMLLSSQFPVNYFTVSELEQWFGASFGEEFTRVTGATLGEVPEGVHGKYWRFNKVFDYAPSKLETADGGFLAAPA